MFNANSGACDWPRNYECGTSPTTTQPSATTQPPTTTQPQTTTQPPTTTTEEATTTTKAPSPTTTVASGGMFVKYLLLCMFSIYYTPCACVCAHYVLFFL